MGSPDNGIYIIQGEISLVVTAMRRSSRWNAHGHQVGFINSTVKIRQIAKLSLNLNSVVLPQELGLKKLIM